MGFDGRKFIQLDAIAYVVVLVVILAAAALWNLLAAEAGPG